MHHVSNRISGVPVCTACHVCSSAPWTLASPSRGVAMLCCCDVYKQVRLNPVSMYCEAYSVTYSHNFSRQACFPCHAAYGHVLLLVFCFMQCWFNWMPKHLAFFLYRWVAMSLYKLIGLVCSRLFLHVGCSAYFWYLVLRLPF